MHSVYVLHSSKDGNLYMGYTTNIAKRFKAHETGSVFSTKARRPLQIIFIETFINKHDALRREHYLKTNEGKKMLKRIIRQTLADLNIHNEKENETSIEEEIANFQLQWKSTRQTAEELVRARGWSETDEDFEMQIEEEAKRQWMEDVEREIDRML